MAEGHRPAPCQDAGVADQVKFVSIVFIFLAGVLGVSIPITAARVLHGKAIYERAVLMIKSFSAGVILSTSLVHVLPEAFNSLSSDFPFPGVAALIGAILALLVDVVATSHAHDYSPVESEDKTKQRIVSQVLEIGIVFHSAIIGVTLGISRNSCTIGSLMAAMSLHQAFEGLGLGGCIAQAGFGSKTTLYMCLMFSATTPAGILLGLIAGFYNGGNSSWSIVEGVLGSLSSGVLSYMALVDLVAVDFFHSKAMGADPSLKKACFVALVLGSASMSLLALWT